MDIEAPMGEQAGPAQAAASSDAVAADEALARRIAAGDVEAWDRFFDRFCSWTYRFAYRHLGANRADAEDLCSDIMMTAATSIARFDPARGGLDVWLLGVARHRLARFCRRRRMEAPFVPEVTESYANPETHVSVTATDGAVTRDAVNRALASLPERQVTVLLGKYVAGYTVEELAASIESTPKAVESLLSRARAAFRSAFEELTESLSGGDERGGK